MRSAILALCLLPAWALAQEPTFMEAATHPGAGQWYSRVFWTSATLRDADADRRAEIKNAFGLTPRLALLPDLVVGQRGIEAATLRLKHRVLQKDTGPIDTWRISLQGGGEWVDGRTPSGRLGVVSTTIRNRHGVNLQGEWRAAAPAEERFEGNASYLYRLRPARYAETTAGAWYAMIESLNRFGPDGQRRSDVAAGLLYEARGWAAEAAVRMEEADDGLRSDRTRLALGLRTLF